MKAEIVARRPELAFAKGGPDPLKTFSNFV
jgi:hypothetical protein